MLKKSNGPSLQKNIFPGRKTEWNPFTGDFFQEEKAVAEISC